MIWTDPQRTLWQHIQQHEFDPDQALSFTRRLARDHGWSVPFAQGAVGEYARFCFLAMVAGPVTPSEEVDEVWHQHLTYSRDYWDVWCPRLGQKLHHDPSRGGPSEQARFRQQYAATLAAYEAYFGPPPEAYWPATHRRFGPKPRFCLVDREAWIMLPRLATLRRAFA